MATSIPFPTDALQTSLVPMGANSTTCGLFDGDETLCMAISLLASPSEYPCFSLVLLLWPRRLTCLLRQGRQWGIPQVKETIIVIKKCIVVISILACSTVIFFIWLFRKYLIFIQRLALYLFIATLFKCISFAMESQYESGPMCTFQAWTLNYFSWAVLLWNCCVTITLYMSAVRSVKTEQLEWVYHVVSWGLSFIISCIPLFGSHYGPAGLWCWVKNEWGWRFGILYLPLIIILPALLVAYIYIMVTVNKQSKTWEGLYDPDSERKKTMLREDLRPLQWYPFVNLAAWVFPLINRIQNAAHFQPIFALYMLHIISDTLYGPIISAVFLMSKEMRALLTKTQIKDAWFGHTSRQLHRQSSVIQEYNPEDVSCDSKCTPSVAVVSASNMTTSDFSAQQGPKSANPPPMFSLTGES